MRLNEGLPAIHTATDAFDLMKLPMVMPDGAPLDFMLPDYGGEQVRSMMDERRISPEWEERVRDANGWLLFLRPDILSEDRDFVTRPIAGLLKPQPTNDPTMPSQWSDQARFIEFLQLLLYARGIGITHRVASPALGVILSCWDELKLDSKVVSPAEILRTKMPLLAAFIEANWLKDAHFVLGLSSLERPLDEKNPDQDFINKGPDKFGYVVTEDGKHTPDLTSPLTEVIHRY